MTQIHLPIFPEGTTLLNSHLAFAARDGKVTYFYGNHPVFIHEKSDLRTFRMITSQFVVAGMVKESQIIKGFGVPAITVKRYVKIYREQGAAGFYQEKAHRGAAVLTDEVLRQAQRLLDEGYSRHAAAKELGIKQNTLSKAIHGGRLHEIKKKLNDTSINLPVATTRSDRSKIDAESPMGMGATNTFDRVFAVIGFVKGVQTKFEHTLDVANAGVLFTLPALLSNGLLRYVDKYFAFSAGYYTKQQIFLVIAFLALCRIKVYEQLRYCAPGEWGKILGLDRIPEVKTLREKIEHLAHQKTSGEWSADLCKEWMSEEPHNAGVLYVDGHTRVYHGKQTKLPAHYVARQRLCLRATVDYWVNAMDGQPFFRINKAIDPGMLSVLRDEIIPLLKREIPGQPTEQQLKDNPLLHRFTIIVDRECYSPDFFKKQKDDRIAIVTYHKFPKEDWPINEFNEYTSNDGFGGKPSAIKLAERGTKLPNGLWVREIRKCTESGHQTSLLATDYLSDLRPIAKELFARWSQENFFKYMRENYNLDRLVDYSTESIPETTKVVNPEYRKIEGQLKSANATFAKRKLEFAEIQLLGDIEPQQVLQYEKNKIELKQNVDDLQEKIKDLKEKRTLIPRHIEFKDLPKEQQFYQLGVESKHFIDTIKMICYRAETALADILKEYLRDKEDARMLIKRICQTSADIVPDVQQKILTIRLHHQASASQDEAVKKLCNELNETKTIFPGTELLLVYELIS